MRILLIGASGQLGSDIVRRWRGHELVPIDHSALEIRDTARVCELLREVRPDAVLNTAAFHQVDRCEEQPELAFGVNAIALRGLALACAEQGAALMQISTDYVFDGAASRPYSEADRPAPLNVYGCSKLAGELLLQATCPRHYIVRTSGLFGRAGPSGKGLNFVQRVIQRARAGERLEVVTDQSLSQTATADLAERLQDLLESERYGLYHVTNSGGYSWHDFARLCLDAAGIQAEVVPTTSDRFAAPARRPTYSVLDNRELRAAGLTPLRPINEALREYVATLK